MSQCNQAQEFFYCCLTPPGFAADPYLLLVYCTTGRAELILNYHSGRQGMSFFAAQQQLDLAAEEPESGGKRTVCGSCTIVEQSPRGGLGFENKEDDGDEDCDDFNIPPVDRLLIPAQVVPISAEDEVIYIVGTRGGKVTKIAGLEGCAQLQELVLRCCLISDMTGIETLTTMKKLELYDNVIEDVTSLERLSQLMILDLSFNSIREIPDDLSLHCPLLTELYLAQNKLRKIKVSNHVSIIHTHFLTKLTINRSSCHAGFKRSDTPQDTGFGR